MKLTIVVFLALSLLAHASVNTFEGRATGPHTPVRRLHRDVAARRATAELHAEKREPEPDCDEEKPKKVDIKENLQKGKKVEKKKGKKDNKKGKKGDKKGKKDDKKPAPKKEEKPAPAPKKKPTGSGNLATSPAPAKGLLEVSSDCGDSRATSDITKVSGPNGHIDFLNCGIKGKGWQPPVVKPNELITANFDTALDDPKSPFGPCKPFWNTFKKHANANGIPPMILAAIAMQESTCNPKATGGGGEQGLMQITKEKCGGAPGGDCKDAEFNIKTGADFFAKTLKECGGNVIETLGKYNGWSRGLTEAKATAARYSDCCRCQNNLDYLQQTFNGWLQNRDGGPLGTFKNLAVCG